MRVTAYFHNLVAHKFQQAARIILIDAVSPRPPQYNSTLSLAQPDSYTSGRESGKVLYIELSQRLVWGATNQIASLWHYVVCGGVSDCERTRYYCAHVFIFRSQSDTPPQTNLTGRASYEALGQLARCIALYQTLSLPFPPPPPSPPTPVSV
jgi:hypothetical protein